MTVRAYFGFAEPDKETFATQRRNRRRVAVATGTAAALGLMGATLATPASADPTYVGYEGFTVDIHPKPGTGGLYFRDAGGHIKGLMGEKDEASVLGCHPNDPTLAWAVQTSRNDGNGGWGAYQGFVRFEYATTEGVNVAIPCGG
ncbi:hypothetical protein ACIHJG_35715 [Streptomyces sp. NPDC052415]|uniref:hypothetical protein n=1 Tax=Streptomyces sp. NPDC052415 TaxID=3365690 RepID=UPI0037CF3516